MLIKNGMIATSSDVFTADILVKDGKIVQIGTNISYEGNDIIDASGKYVIPGGIDVHTHLNLDVGTTVTCDDFYTGTVAAAFGGTTSIIDHIAFGPKGCALRHQVDKYHGLAEGNAVIDYGFHGVIQHVNETVLADMEKLVEEGITSFKMYLAYDFKLSDAEAFEVVRRVKELGLIITFHPENNDIINILRKDFIGKGQTAPKYHELSRPEECESESINRIISMASIVGDAPIYIVHLSSDQSLSFAKKARERGQKNIFVETCPQYLFLDKSKYELPGLEGLKYVMSPPLRDKINNELLWKGIKNNDIDVVATDHCPFNFATQKMMGKDDFTKCPNGAPGLELRMPLLFSEGVSKGRISINKYVDICCTRPAKLFGLYPHKGTLAIGADADIVIIDPDKKVKITKDMIHENIDYTMYEGMELTGYPVVTISRGEILVQNGKFIGKKGRGRFMKRTKPIL